MSLAEVILFLVLFIFIYKYLRKTGGLDDGDKKYPPGPWWSFPFLGYMPFMAFKPLNKLKNLANSYGDICSIHLGSHRAVLLNSYDVIREAFKEDTFCGRPDLKMLEVRNKGVHLGLVCNEGRHWMEQRKFTLRHLRELGFGKCSMEGLILEELQELISNLKKSCGTPIDLKNDFNLVVLNALWRIICGKRYSHDDPLIKNILNKTSADLAETAYTGPLLFLPWLLKLAPGLTRWNEFKSSMESLHEFLRGIIEEHKGSHSSSITRDFIDAYLTEIDKIKDPRSSFYKEKGEHSLLVVLVDLFMAGADTTSATLYWAFLYIVRNQKVQSKLHEEIDLVIGNGTINLEHRKMMPYTEATITEVLRKSSLVPMGLFHSSTCDTQLLGYDIPKGSVIIANLYNLNYDEKYWEDPHEFRPERFLNKKDGKFLPFSIGKRVCPGENLARDQLFIFFVGLLQRFKILPDPSKIGMPTEEPNNGVILSARPYSIVVEERGIIN